MSNKVFEDPLIQKYTTPPVFWSPVYYVLFRVYFSAKKRKLMFTQNNELRNLLSAFTLC